MAIALDGTSFGTTEVDGTQLTWTHIVAGDNRLLVVGVPIAHNTIRVQSVTYAGSALTFIAGTTNTVSAPDTYVGLWYILAPNIGTNTVAVNYDGTLDNLGGGAISYTDVAQTGNPEGSITGTVSGTAGTVTVTTVADNSWVVDAVHNSDNQALTVGAGQTERLEFRVALATSEGAMSDEGPVTPAGAVAMSWTSIGTDQWAMVAASFAPVGGGGTTVTTAGWKSLMGVGR